MHSRNNWIPARLQRQGATIEIFYRILSQSLNISTISRSLSIFLLFVICIHRTCCTISGMTCHGKVKSSKQVLSASSKRSYCISCLILQLLLIVIPQELTEYIGLKNTNVEYQMWHLTSDYGPRAPLRIKRDGDVIGRLSGSCDLLVRGFFGLVANNALTLCCFVLFYISDSTWLENSGAITVCNQQYSLLARV